MKGFEWGFKFLNMTPKRIEVLRYIMVNPGAGVRNVAYEIIQSDRWSKRGSTSEPAAEMAMRAGAAYVSPMINVGLIHREPTTINWGMVSLTEAGINLVETINAVEAAAKLGVINE